MDRKEAIEKIRGYYYPSSGKDLNEALETLIPELKESEDERTRKEMLEYCYKRMNNEFSSITIHQVKRWFAWLEKQGEQNPKSADFIPTDCTSDAKNENRWHKVEDSLPDNAREVLCKDAIGNFFIGRYYNDGDYWEVSMYDEPDKSNKDNPPVIMWVNIPSCSQNLANSEKTCKDKQSQPTKYTLEQAARIFLDALSDTPYNNKPVTDAQVITRELLKFLSDAHSYNPNAINEQNPAWSEEDEVNFHDVMWAIEQARTIAKDENDMGNLWYAERWLKSIKERVQPLLKYEWSEEDENKKNDAITAIDLMMTDSFKETHPNLYKAFGEAKDWLKSLKERCTWKPSDEQMRALEDAKMRMSLDGYGLCPLLQTLINDLKKLKG